MYKRIYFYEVVLKSGLVFHGVLSNISECNKLAARIAFRNDENDVYLVHTGFDLVKEV